MVSTRTAALRASETNLQVTLDSIGDGVLVTDTRGRITRINPVAEKLMGWTQAEAVGEAVETVFRIVNEHSREPAVVPVDEVLRTGAIKGLANHTVLIARDGSERAIADSAAPIHDGDGRVQGVVLVFRDVSEERDAERALEASEKRYREFIEVAPYGVFVQTAGTFAYLNPKALELLGAEDESQLRGRPVLEFLHPDSREAVAERIRQLNQMGIPAPPLEEQWRRLDGSLFHAEATAVPHVHDGIRGALVMLHDITDRKAAEAQRDRFFDLSPDPQCIIDANGRFLRVNQAFTEVLGWSPEQLLASGYLEFVHPEDLPRAREGQETLRTGSASHLETRFRCREGGWRWLSWSFARAPEDGLLYGVARDVTERRDTIEALTRARAEAEYANRAKSAFLATMSHEIRTPMNGVVGLADVLSHGELGEHEADLVQNIRVSAQTLLRLIDDILDFSKIEAGRLELENAPVCLEELVEDLCLSLAPVAATKGVRLAVFVAPEVPRHVLGDEVRLRQLLYNLVGNAIKFSGGQQSPGQVAVRVEVSGQAPLRLLFTVVDNGIGMSDETLESLFQPFTQAEVSTTRRFGGTGLGLAICQRLVEMMEGTIAIDSRPGQGTTVRMTLPFALADTDGDGNTPDLAGVHCLIVATGGIPGADWRTYLRHAGARADCVADLDSATAMDFAPDSIPVVILDQREPAHTALPINQLFERGGDLRYVLVSGGRRRRTRLQGGRVVIVEGELLRRLALLKAVALAAGRLPLDAVLDASERPSRVRLPAAGAADRASGPILVVEDDAMNRKVILEQLSLLGYRAEVAMDGADALRCWRDKHHALILSDLHMPVMDGYALARAIRSEEPPDKRTPIIVLSANALRGEANRAYGIGIDDYLTKPVSLERLDAVLGYWLARRPAVDNGQNHREEDPAPMDNDGIDLAILQNFIGDDPVKLRNFLADYRDAALRLRIDIHRAEQADDLLQLASLAHRLKSSSRWVGALALGELCAGLEQAGRAGDRAAITDYLSRFDQNHARIMADIEHHLRDESP